MSTYTHFSQTLRKTNCSILRLLKRFIANNNVTLTILSPVYCFNVLSLHKTTNQYIPLICVKYVTLYTSLSYFWQWKLYMYKEIILAFYRHLFDFGFWRKFFKYSFLVFTFFSLFCSYTILLFTELSACVLWTNTSHWRGKNP
jgi:hypothetical protein